mmetsp:Transcript_37752/g.74928  ORF Transcript_37752/g.74928 Transcript_37752/m.74928 type:complete len:308 (+) Transcript_37752:68-991(+)
MSGLIAGDPANQCDWHEAHRDMMKNMYRTSYSDMTQRREVHVRSDFPSGYGGHVPSVRHDVTFRNTAFDREQGQRRYHPTRDTHPSFEEQIAGIPCHTSNPRGARNRPTYGTIPHDGTTAMPKFPWAVATTQQEPLTHRMPPPTMRNPEVFQPPRSLSARGAQSHELAPFGTPRGLRSNEAAKTAGTILAMEATQQSSRDVQGAGSNGAMPGAPLARGVPGHVPLDYERDNVYTSLRSNHGWDRHADPMGERHPASATLLSDCANDSESFAALQPAAELGVSTTLDSGRSRRSVSFVDGSHLETHAN